MSISLLPIATPQLPASSTFPIATNNVINKKSPYDVKIYVGKESNVQLFTANSEVLKAHSTYFNIALSSNWVKKSDDGWMIINLPDISPDVFDPILNYLCNGKVSYYRDLFLGDTYSCLQRIKAADKLALDDYIQHEQSFLINHRSEWIRVNFVKIYKLVLDLPALTTLKHYLLGLLCYQPILMFNNPNHIKYLDKDTLIWLLKKDNLQMEEADIWDNIILWGMIKSKKISPSSLPSSLTLSSYINTIKKKVKNWSTDDWSLLHKTLKNILHLVRMNNISTEDYERRVKPFENLFLINNNDNDDNDNNNANISCKHLSLFIRKHRNEDSMNISDNVFNIFNNTVPNTTNATTKLKSSYRRSSSSYVISHYKRAAIIDSTIINISHVGVIANWIKGNSLKLDELRKVYDNPIPIPFYFKLLLRGSKDGFSPEIFHKWCDDYGAPTLIIIKLKNSLQIIGGFNYFSWRSPLMFPTFHHDKYAFIFSLCDKYGNKDNFRLARPRKILNNEGWKALKFSRNDGPCFGKSDLQLRSNKTCYCKQHDYDDSITDEFGVFEIDDYEIFRCGFS